MESIGDCYGVILNHPELRQGLIREAERSRRSRHASSTSRMLRRLLAGGLHALAARLEPGALAGDAASPRQPVVTP